MINWRGQSVKEGDIVYRGARERDSSSFRIGRVRKVNPEKQVVTVLWLFEQSTDWENKTYKTIPRIMKTWRYNNGDTYYSKSISTCGIDTVFKVYDDPDIRKLVAEFDGFVAELTDK